MIYPVNQRIEYEYRCAEYEYRVAEYDEKLSGKESQQNRLAGPLGGLVAGRDVPSEIELAFFQPE